MKIFKKILKIILIIISIPFAYLIISFILTTITVNNSDESNNIETIYLNTNGVHLDIILPLSSISKELKKDIIIQNKEQYISFGWGDENFYINTPTWGDLTIKNATIALFMKSKTLMHITRYSNIKADWIAIKLSTNELKNLNAYIAQSFQLDQKGDKIILENNSYGNNDNFYKAKGSYSCLYTCNSWVNSAFKTNGLKACYWTPFDFGLMNKYK